MAASDHYLNTTRRPRVETIGRCIYCTEPRPGRLTREHVIPRALGGGLILREATCDFHQELINKEIETPVLSQWLRSFRRHHGLPANKNSRKGQLRMLPFLIDRVGSTAERRYLPEPELPPMLMLPKAAYTPGCLRAAEPGPFVYGVQTFYHPESMVGFVRRNHGLISGAASITFEGTLRIDLFTRFLAKVAHGVAVSHIGANFEPFLLDIIEGRGTDGAGYFIGSASHAWATPARPKSHLTKFSALQIEGNGFLACVELQFFAELQSPAYAVVVGGFHPGTHPCFEGASGLVSRAFG